MKEDGWSMTKGFRSYTAVNQISFSQYSGKVREMCQKQSCFLKGETEDLRQTKGDVCAGTREIRIKIEMA